MYSQVHKGNKRWGPESKPRNKFARLLLKKYLQVVLCLPLTLPVTDNHRNILLNQADSSSVHTKKSLNLNTKSSFKDLMYNFHLLCINCATYILIQKVYTYFIINQNRSKEKN